MYKRQTLHLLLGKIAADEGDSKTAALHYELGLQDHPNMASLLNNYAWLIGVQTEDEPARALELINAAISESPKNVEFLDTRGEIQMRLKNWKQAISDFEQVISVVRDRPRIYSSLARAYSELGLDAQAERFQVIARELEQRSRSVQPGQNQ